MQSFAIFQFVSFFSSCFYSCPPLQPNVSTIEYYEYKVMQARIGDKVKCIIPPDEKQGQFDPATGYLRVNDALSFEYVNTSYLKEFINNDKMTIILFKNPPYRDITAGETASNKEVTDKEITLINGL